VGCADALRLTGAMLANAKQSNREKKEQNRYEHPNKV
jgi:hypothetical protein